MQPAPEQPPPKNARWLPAIIVGAIVLMVGGWWLWSAVGEEYAVGEKIQLSPERGRGGGVRQIGDVLRSLGNPGTRPARSPNRAGGTTRPAVPATGPR